MALREILHYPDPRLRTVAKPVEVFDDSIRTLVKDMAETMYAAPGIGLAATQIDVHQRVIVIDITPDKSDLKVLINPQLADLQGETVMEEGCLSVPGVYDNVQRAERIRVKAMDENGKPFEMEADDLLAVCIQHEIDHLDGKVFVDYLSPLKQQRIGKKLQKRQRVAL
ncbi:MAG: peptide deformylase [Acidithiobacillales bacterium SG8_45]|jgi:peptide deformylase|nr:MAG: peptide deformylase [Acidithiobacillales bacterium SG8_45]